MCARAPTVQRWLAGSGGAACGPPLTCVEQRSAAVAWSAAGDTGGRSGRGSPREVVRGMPIAPGRPPQPRCRLVDQLTRQRVALQSSGNAAGLVPQPRRGGRSPRPPPAPTRWSAPCCSTALTEWCTPGGRRVCVWEVNGRALRGAARIPAASSPCPPPPTWQARHAELSSPGLLLHRAS